ncbi:MAG: hypothetical protein IT257_04725 [Chitinophagaceae bacterium]|nr:hypothetical protein [Chitinophagaceae bacterium]
MKYLDILIGLIFVYLLLSLFSTLIMEYISTIGRMRATLLKETIRKMLDPAKDDPVNAFYKMPLIKFFGERRWAFWSSKEEDNLPSYIEPKNFATTLLQFILGPDYKTNPQTAGGIVGIINAHKFISESTRDHLLLLISKTQAGGKSFFDQLEIEIENWFNQTMERTSTWYKRKVQYILLYVGLAVAIAFNADTLRMAGQLNQDDKLRNELVKNATDFVAKHDSLPMPQAAQQTEVVNLRDSVVANYLRTADLSANLLGWKNDDGDWEDFKKYFFRKLIGFLLTAIAISLGSNFWFDMLKKLLNIKVLAEKK